MSFKRKVFAFCCLLSDTEAPFRLEIRGIYTNIEQFQKKVERPVKEQIQYLSLPCINRGRFRCFPHVHTEGELFSEVLFYRILVNLASRLRDNLTAFI